MKKNLLVGLVALLVLLLVVGYGGVAASGVEQAKATPESSDQSSEPQRTIKVSGNAQVMVVPDEVILTLGVESWAVKLVKAKADNDLIVQNVIGVTKEFNIPAKYVQTDYLNVQPSFENYEHHVITGYYVRRNVVITLKDLTQFEDLLSAVLESGVNYVHGIDFRTTELRKHRDQARDLALQAASEKAQAMATKLDQTIGEPLAVVELTSIGTRHIPRIGVGAPAVGCPKMWPRTPQAPPPETWARAKRPWRPVRSRSAQQ